MTTQAATIEEIELAVEGLDAPLRIVRDRWGTPHAKAASARDAFFAQGFCLGLDRAWQLELFRHMAHGRAAALLNEKLVPLDKLNRTLGYGRDAEREWAAQSDEARMVLSAYADGVNAGIAVEPGAEEFAVLDRQMAPWSPVDSLAILKMVSANQHWAVKIANGRVAALLGPEAVRAVTPDVPEDAAMIVPSGRRWSGGGHAWEDALALLGEQTDVRRNGVDGSNCWVVDAAHSADGAAIVCGDPHLPLSVPPQWYVMHMDCPEFNVAGPCSPGYPGPVYYGHNGTVAWTMTHAQGDRWDVYRERIRPGDAPTAEFQGEQEPLARREEQIEVRGGDPVAHVVWETRHGPVVEGDPATDEEVLAAKFALAESCHDFDALLPKFAAANIRDVRSAFQRYDSISGNFCFADADGEIGYQYTGRTPIRDCALTPVPGWDGSHEWNGEIAKDQLPQQSNPDNGILFTANNRTTTPDYPHYLSFSQTPFRANRLRQLLIEPDRDDWTTGDMPQIQADRTSLHAQAFAAAVQARHVTDEAAPYKQMLCHWSGRLDPDSPEAALYAETVEQLSKRTVRPFFAPAKRLEPGAGEERRIVLEQLAADSALALPDGATWESVLSEALVAAAAHLDELCGEGAWRYDAVHHSAWRHNLGRDPQLADRFNLQNILTGGDDFTVNNAGYAYGKPGDHGVSNRLILSLADPNDAQFCLPPGNSGRQASPHYDDNLQRWFNIEYYPLHTAWQDIEANAESDLALSPR